MNTLDHYLHFVASLVKIHRVVTGDRNHFLISSVHYSL